MKYLEITEDNHKQSLDELNKHAKNGGESVVALTAPWCGHCKALKPELNKMRSKLKGGNGIVANVSDKYHSQLDMDTNVDGFPTIRHFKGGKKVRDYEGKRAAEELANFANNSLNSAVQTGGGKRKKTRRRKKRGGGGARKTKRGGRRKKRRKTRNKKKRNKKRSKTKKRGGGLCASRQQPACEDMSAIATHTFSPQNIRSTQQADANAPSLIMKIGQCSVCFKIGEGWLRQNTSAALAVALWLDALTKHKWIPYGKNLAERNGNIFLLVARLAKEMNEAIKTVQNA